MWTPAPESLIQKNIDWCNDILSLRPSYLKFWEYIKIEPEKWNEDTMGDEGNGFWVVAIIGKNVIYYNDIEEGFNFSKFTTFGKIDEYKCSQFELHEMIIGIYDEINKLEKSLKIH